MVSSVEPPRYLVSFQPRRIVHRHTDVLILGSGLAGLRAALAVDPSLSVVVITKEAASSSNSQWAQGGIAAVWNPEDSFVAHVDDTLKAGKGLCDPEVVDLVVREAPTRVHELMDWGTVFDSKPDGKLAITREGGHSFDRIVHALGDATGKEVMRAVLERVGAQENIQMLEGTFTLDLITEHGRCIGALTWSPAVGIQAVWASQTILATGGCGQIFRETTNPPVATGDGIAMAYRAGVILQDMEFMQFHPTVLYVAGSARSLISEAVRGEGAFLRDRNGVRFMPDVDPQAELAPRDIVARAIIQRMAETQHPCVYLDTSHLDRETIRARFPGITQLCAKFGLDFAKDQIPVRPGAHYMVGGVRVDLEGRTSLPGLWAAGEVASTGLHGANRLASNSLLEALVFGHRCGLGASRAALNDNGVLRVPGKIFAFPQTIIEPFDEDDVRNALSSLLFRDVGIRRAADRLASAREQVDFWCMYVMAREMSRPAGWELQNMLTVAGVMIRSALQRTESRGTHFREDYPETDDAQWRVHLLANPRPFRFQRKPIEAEPAGVGN